jgi:hypothetical protein
MSEMYLHDTLLACPVCSCHARSSAAECPSCGAALRNQDGSRTPTAGAVLLGLVLAGAPIAAGCSSGPTVSADYGVATTTSASSGSSSGSTSSTSASGSTSTSSSTSSHGGFGGAMTDYGVPMTSSASSSSGAGGAGGSH